MTAAAVAVIALGAVAVRFWALSSQPGGLYPDEAAEGVSAERLLNQPGYHPVFLDDDGGREALYAYIVAAVFRALGASVLTLRGTAAALGVAGVIATWFALRRFGVGVALSGMAWAAGSLWLICLSRDGFRDIITVPVGALALAALLRWGDRPSRGAAILAGAASALGLWAYEPLKLIPLLVILWLLWMRARDPTRFVQVWGQWRWAALAYLVVAAPMIWTAITDPLSYFGRIGGVSPFNPALPQPEAFPVHVLRTIGMFLVTGDPNGRHDVSALPLLGPVLFVPFALGIWRAVRLRDDHGHALVLLGLPVFLLAPLLATEADAPHFLRSLGLAPYVAACVGLGCLEIATFARRVMRPRAAAAASWAACAAAVAAVGVASVVTYLQRPVVDRYDDFSYADVALAQAAAGRSTAVIVDDFDAYDVRFLDAGALPAIVEPQRRIADPSAYALIVAPTRADLAAAAGSGVAARAHAVAFDPRGAPVVFVVDPRAPPGASG